MALMGPLTSGGIAMASSKHKILSLSAALAAFTVPAAGHASLTAPDQIGARASINTDVRRATVNLPVGEDLMSFTVKENAQGMVVADHSSHASHSSHSSHSSHYSSR